ncbi:MAG: polyprenyl synthetase family protein, partial [Planctomycetes bacterium]|nr:polyprenyl synthetase family protein [Planctomycetota bacterium]
LAQAVGYFALAPGKRIRPFLVVICCELVGGARDDAWPAACAVECIHAFSLIHDDLPAMDDDDLRRGRPTCHRKFGEGIAILAGDALVALAFERLASSGYDDSIVAALVCELARASGWRGMIGGQASDLVGEDAKPDENLVRSIHERKTAALLASSCRIGAMVGRAGTATRDRLGAYGQALGLAFQIADDLLDVTASTKALGKNVQKDAGAGKQTFPQCVGVEGSRRAAGEAVVAAIAALESFGPAADDLRTLAHYVIARSY